jgi:hypothetical protein
MRCALDFRSLFHLGTVRPIEAEVNCGTIRWAVILIKVKDPAAAESVSQRSGAGNNIELPNRAAIQALRVFRAAKHAQHPGRVISSSVCGDRGFFQIRFAKVAQIGV